MEETASLIFTKSLNRERFLKFIRSLTKSEEEAKYLVFEIATEFLFCNNLHQVAEQIKKKELWWNHPNFQVIRDELQEEDDFLENPPDVEEGVMECVKCHSKRTFSFSKQMRRADESATVFIRCSNCNYTYKI